MAALWLDAITKAAAAWFPGCFKQSPRNGSDGYYAPVMPHATLVQPAGRTIVVGDVHGCLDELMALLADCMSVQRLQSQSEACSWARVQHDMGLWLTGRFSRALLARAALLLDRPQ